MIPQKPISGNRTFKWEDSPEAPQNGSAPSKTGGAYAPRCADSEDYLLSDDRQPPLHELRDLRSSQ